MPFLIAAHVALMLVVTPTSQAGEQRRSVGSFKSLALMVERVSSDAEAKGITDQDLKEMVVGALSSKNLLSKITLGENDPCPCLYVNLTLQKALFATLAMQSVSGQKDFRSEDFSYFLSLSVLEPVVRLRDNKQVLAETWRAGALRESPGVPLHSYVLDSVRSAVSEFAAAVEQGQIPPPK